MAYAPAMGLTGADGFIDRAIEILERSPLIDGHNDLAIALRERIGGIGVSAVDLREPVEGLDTDIPRLRAGRVGGQFWSIWVPARLPEEQALPMRSSNWTSPTGSPIATPTSSGERRRPTRSRPCSKVAGSPRCSGSRAAR